MKHWTSAIGNHHKGYRGALMEGDNPNDRKAKPVWQCEHRHPSTTDARDCAARYWAAEEANAVDGWAEKDVDI